MKNKVTVLNDDDISVLLANLHTDSDAIHAYFKPIPELAVPGVSEFYGIHLAIWQLRENDLQAAFPLHTPSLRKNFLAWCVVSGQLEYAALRELEPFWQELAKPAVINETEWSGGVSRLLQLLIVGRKDLGIEEDLDDVLSQEHALGWYFCHGGFNEVDARLRPCPTWQRSFLVNDSQLDKSRFGKLIYRARPDVRAAFDIETETGKLNFKQWLTNHATTETGLSTLIQPYRKAWPAQSEGTVAYEFGVNLIGYAFGELGIGEDVRMAARSLNAAKVPFTIINVNPGSNIRQSDRTMEAWVSEDSKYGINIICLTALEHLRIYLEQGKTLFAGRYNIGYWPWELHYWPKRWKHCFNLIDEMWASSRHIERAASRASKTTVRYMPMAVEILTVDLDKAAKRLNFSLPEEKTLFVFSFDGNSHIKRKNPIGIVNAFNIAFPKKSEPAGLVIKCMRPDKQNPEWQNILKHASRDNRIIIIDDMLSKQEVLDLYKACDCFVSLHRAEGFGRGIAEAILLELDVIATNYGGNVEFCLATGARLIDYDLIPLEDGDYVEWSDNYWGEPHIEKAATAMQAVLAGKIAPPETNGGKSFRQEAKFIFSTETVGQRYQKCLVSISGFLQ